MNDLTLEKTVETTRHVHSDSCDNTCHISRGMHAACCYRRLCTPHQRLPNDSAFQWAEQIPKIAPFHGTMLIPSNTWFLDRPTRVSPTNSISIDSAVFVGLTNVTDRQTDTHTHRQIYHACLSVAIGHIFVLVHSSLKFQILTSDRLNGVSVCHPTKFLGDRSNRC